MTAPALTDAEIEELLAARDLAAATLDTSVVDPPASPVAKTLSREGVEVGLVEAGTAIAVTGRLRANLMALVAEWVLAADEMGVSRVRIARLSGLSRTTVYALLDGREEE